MRRLLPMPWHSLMLIAVWLLLNGFSYGQLLLAVILAWLIPIITYPYVRGHAPVKKPLAMMADSLPDEAVLRDVLAYIQSLAD